jgi:hypothetical protein
LAVPLAVCWENIAGQIRPFRPEKANKKVTDFCIFGRGANGRGQQAVLEYPNVERRAQCLNNRAEKTKRGERRHGRSLGEIDMNES